MRIKHSVLLTIFLSVLFLNIFGQSIPSRPYPPRLVNDFAKILNEGEINLLESDLVAFDDSTGVQVTLVTVNDFGNYSRAEFADILGEQWGVGRKKLNNGVVILIKPTGRQNEREVHIAVGYGLESVLPDAICKRIVEVEMIPLFEQERFYEGIVKGLKIIKELAMGEYPPEAYKKRTDSNPFMGIIPIVIFIIIYLLISGARNSQSGMGSKNALFWTLLMMMSNRGGGGSGGGWGNFSSGGGSFGGFGGGSFGGGGAGGKW